MKYIVKGKVNSCSNGVAVSPAALNPNNAANVAVVVSASLLEAESISLANASLSGSDFVAQLTSAQVQYKEVTFGEKGADPSVIFSAAHFIANKMTLTDQHQQPNLSSLLQKKQRSQKQLAQSSKTPV